MEDEGEVILRDRDFLRRLLASLEIEADKLLELLCLRFVIKEDGIVLKQALAEVVKLSEFLGIVVRGRHVPVEVVLKKDALYFVVFDEGELLRIERSYVFGWQVFLEGAFLADGEDELHKRLEDVVRGAWFGLRPKQLLQVIILELVEKRGLSLLDDVFGNHEVDVTQLGVFVTVEEVLLHRAFQRFFL